MKRRFLILTLVALLLPAALSPAARAAGGEDGRRASPFADVAPGDWYYEDVMALYELGLASGQRTDRFAPEEEMTVGEALALAARLRSLHMYGDSEIGPLAFPGELWYEPYVSFLQSLGSIGLEFEGAYTRPALRAEAAHILANAHRLRQPELYHRRGRLHPLPGGHPPALPVGHPQRCGRDGLLRPWRHHSAGTDGLHGRPAHQ